MHTDVSVAIIFDNLFSFAVLWTLRKKPGIFIKPFVRTGIWSGFVLPTDLFGVSNVILDQRCSLHCGNYHWTLSWSRSSCLEFLEKCCSEKIKFPNAGSLMEYGCFLLFAVWKRMCCEENKITLWKKLGVWL